MLRSVHTIRTTSKELKVFSLSRNIFPKLKVVTGKLVVESNNWLVKIELNQRKDFVS